MFHFGKFIRNIIQDFFGLTSYILWRNHKVLSDNKAVHMHINKLILRNAVTKYKFN